MSLSKVAVGLFVLSAFEGLTLHALTDEDEVHILALKDGKTIVGGISLVKYLKAYEVTTVYSDNPRVAYLLFISALETCKQLFPDNSVSPAAKTLINRWFQKYKDTPYVKGSDPMKATYLAPPDLKSPVPVKKEQYTDSWNDKILLYREKFRENYRSEKSKRTDLDYMLKTKDIGNIFDVLRKNLDTDKFDEMKKWVHKNVDSLRKLIDPGNLTGSQTVWITRNYPELIE